MDLDQTCCSEPFGAEKNSSDSSDIHLIFEVTK